MQSQHSNRSVSVKYLYKLPLMLTFLQMKGSKGNQGVKVVYW